MLDEKGTREMFRTNLCRNRFDMRVNRLQIDRRNSSDSYGVHENVLGFIPTKC